ncbi:MAG: hypothetical protein KU38_11320 [Sulfurovum sp. FS08-3]|nr:MAG: hypothetical protein KU38_11320 [Sulfurovum sp. FS08-3]
MQNKGYLGGIISLLLGLTFGFTLLTFLYTLISYFSQGILEAFFFAFLYTMPGLFMIVMLEFVLLHYAKFEEQQKQTQLMEEILAKLDSKNRTDTTHLPNQ